MSASSLEVSPPFDEVQPFIQEGAITLANIVSCHPRIVDPYQGKKKSAPIFTLVSRVAESTMEIYERTSTKPGKWYQTRITDTPTEAVGKKQIFDIFQVLGRGIFQVSKSYLSHVPEREVCSQTLRLMRRTIEEFQDFAQAEARDPSDLPLNFINYLRKYSAIPKELLTPEKTWVPIKGLMGLLAIAKMVGESIAIGQNTGFVWIKDEGGRIIAAQTIKIDVDISFQSETASEAYSTETSLDSQKLQMIHNDDLISLPWDCLSPTQKTEFLLVLYNLSRYSPEIFDYLLYREGKFNNSGIEYSSKKQIDQYKQKLTQRLNTLFQIYHKELTELKQTYQAQMRNIQQMDYWANFFLNQQKQLIESTTASLRAEFQKSTIEMQAKEKELREQLLRLELSSSSSSVATSSSARTKTTPIEAFGAREWNSYYGNVGEEPPLPSNIKEILKTPCPFSKKTISQSAMLVLIPATVDEQPFTIDLLESLISKCKNRMRRTAFAYYWMGIKDNIGKIPVKESYWVLMTREPLPRTRSCLTSEQQKILLKSNTSNLSPSPLDEACIPTILEAATCILMEFARTGTRLFPMKPHCTFITCQDIINGIETHIGGFDEKEGLHIGNPFEHITHPGLACLWRLHQDG